MKTTFYLVATLIEHYDKPPTDTADKGEVILDLDTVYEWRDEDGNGLTVTIEEMNVK